MPAEPWLRVKDIFQEALERPPEARDAFLRAQCGGDATLQSEVESLLAAHAEAAGFLSQPAAAPVPIPDAVDRRIGPYKIVGRVGHGGMGIVYRAVRDDDAFQKVVALK